MRSRRTVERDAAPLPLGHGAGPDQHELEIEQLVERQPPPAQLRLGGGGGPVHRAERLGQRREVRASARSGSGRTSSESAMSASR